MCDTTGRKMQHYYDVQRINGVVKPVGEYLFDRTSAGVFHIGDAPERGTRLFEGFGKVKEIKGECGVVGVFDDGSMYLVNRDFLVPRTFVVEADEPMTAMGDGVFAPLPRTEITLAAGEGILIK